MIEISHCILEVCRFKLCCFDLAKQQIAVLAAEKLIGQHFSVHMDNDPRMTMKEPLKGNKLNLPKWLIQSSHLNLTEHAFHLLTRLK